MTNLLIDSREVLFHDVKTGGVQNVQAIGRVESGT
jgi:hypothetical protein